MAHKMECHIVYTRTRKEAENLAGYFNNQGIPTEVKPDSVFGYSIHTDKEHLFIALLIYLSCLTMSARSALSATTENTTPKKEYRPRCFVKNTRN
jgi:hypothetical protein